jgi:thiol-disulfide isomerase/thioredoxin
MAQKTSVVTPERFAQGLTYQGFLAQAKVNLDRFQQYYGTATVTPEDVQFFRKAVQHPRGAPKVLALGEDWCPDVYRGLPVMARIAEASGMEMRVFARDQNLDIMNEFLKDGKHLSIPTFVFYTREHKYIGHWIERPALANRERAEMAEVAKREMPTASEEEVTRESRRRTNTRYTAWQQETVRELRQLLTEKLKL